MSYLKNYITFANQNKNNNPKIIMKKIIMFAGILCLCTLAACNGKKTEENGQKTDSIAMGTPQTACTHHHEMSEEQQALMAQWANFDNLTEQEQKDLLATRKACIDKMLESKTCSEDSKTGCSKDGKICCSKDGKTCCSKDGKTCCCKDDKTCCCKDGKNCCCKDGKTCCCKDGKNCCCKEMTPEQKAQIAEMLAATEAFKAKWATFDQLDMAGQKALVDEFDALNSCHHHGDKPCAQEK